jgi:hypothetical protein
VPVTLGVVAASTLASLLGDRNLAAGLVFAHTSERTSGWKACAKDVGQERWISVEGTVVRSPEGQPVRWLGVTRDITEHKKAEEVGLRLVSIVESSDDAIVSKDLNGVHRELELRRGTAVWLLGRRSDRRAGLNPGRTRSPGRGRCHPAPPSARRTHRPLRNSPSL